MPRLLLVLAGLVLVLACAWFLGPPWRAAEAPRPGAPAPAAEAAQVAPDAPGLEPRALDDEASARNSAAAEAPAAEPAPVPGAPTVLTVSVLDGRDGRHLDGIELRRSSGPIVRRGSWTAPYRVSPRESDERLRSDLASPFELDIGRDAPEALWITAPGFVPYRFLRPARALRAELVVRLERESGIEVRLSGDVPAPEDAFVRVYAAPPGTVAAAGWVRDERPALSPLRFGGLPPGGWCVALEQRTADEKPSAVLALARVELARGEWTTVLLDAASLEDALRPALLTLRFPESWRAESGAAATLVPEAGNALRLGKQESLGEIEDEKVGPIGLVPGRYALHLEPGHVALPLELAPGERRELSVPEVEFQELAITVLEADRRPAELENFGWRTLLDWDGRPTTGLPSRLRIRVAGAPFRFRAVAAPLELTFFRRDGDMHQVTVDPRGARELEVLLPPETWLEIELSAFEDSPGPEWFTDVRVSAQGVVLEGSNVSVFSGADVLRGRIQVQAAGEVELEFPPLPSHGSLRPRRVVLVEGATTKVRLDPEDLEIVPVEQH